MQFKNEVSIGIERTMPLCSKILTYDENIFNNHSLTAFDL